jgi:hypothetical protein
VKLRGFDYQRELRVECTQEIGAQTRKAFLVPVVRFADFVLRSVRND